MRIRRQARALALKALFEIDCVGHKPEPVLDYLISDENLPPEGAEFAHNLVEGVTAHRAQLDEIIRQHAPEWPVDQLATIDRNILRIALYELQYSDDVPIKVAINEAVELAKLFGSDTASRFVNGVLGAFLVRHPAGELRH
ncbi:MAG TPA: transcription antitermination factor NusB [Anaerolineae bacterium]